MLFTAISSLYITFKGYQKINSTIQKWYWRYKLLSWTYKGSKKIKLIWDFSANKMSENWNKVKHNTWMNYAYYFKYNEWLNIKEEQINKIFNKIQQEQNIQQIKENKERQIRLNYLEKINKEITKEKQLEKRLKNKLQNIKNNDDVITINREIYNNFIINQQKFKKNDIKNTDIFYDINEDEQNKNLYNDNDIFYDVIETEKNNLLIKKEKNKQKEKSLFKEIQNLYLSKNKKIQK